MPVTEFGFSVDDFNNPKLYKNAEAISTLLVRLLLLEPGTYQSHPKMGVGLYSNYRYSVQGNASKLRDHFQQQIEEYLPQFRGVRVEVVEKNKTYYILAEIDSIIYNIYYDIEKASVSADIKRLSDLQ